MDATQRNQEAVSFWEAACANDNVKALYAFAEQHWADATIKTPDGQEHSAARYAQYIYACADLIVNEAPQETPELTEQLQLCAIMVALEECCFKNNWTYGSKLLYSLKKAGIKLDRTVIAGFLAQEGTWNSNRSKGDLLAGNVVAVGIYCGKLSALCRAMTGSSITDGGRKEDLIETVKLGEEMTKPDEILTKYMTEYGISYLESLGVKDAEDRIGKFLRWLLRTDFYYAPCSTRYHLSIEGGLAAHTINVMMQLIWLTLPANKQQIGACVMAAIGHDLCKIGVYNKQYKAKKMYLGENEPAPAGAFVKEDQGGRFYWADDTFYTFEDAMPFGHGRKSAYMLIVFFPEIDEAVFCAIDGHMADPDQNPAYLHQLAEHALALNLHIADTLATCLMETDHN